MKIMVADERIKGIEGDWEFSTGDVLALDEAETVYFDGYFDPEEREEPEITELAEAEIGDILDINVHYGKNTVPTKAKLVEIREEYGLKHYRLELDMTSEEFMSLIATV